MHLPISSLVLLIGLSSAPPEPCGPPGDLDQACVIKTFKAAFAVTDDFVVNDEGDHYEIIVTHPSTEGRTGGAEQYILDKKTGEWKMGWHEHPMPMPTPVLDKVGDHP